MDYDDNSRCAQTNTKEMEVCCDSVDTDVTVIVLKLELEYLLSTR